MWGTVLQLPVRGLVLGSRVWGLFFHLLSLGLWALFFCLFMLFRVPCVCVQEGSKRVLTAAQVCSIYVLLQGTAWSAQLVGSWVMLHVCLCRTLLETIRCIPLIPLCEQAARWLVQAGVQAGKRAGKNLSRVWAVAAFVRRCAQMFFLGMYLCMHVCFATISNKVRVKVRMPFRDCAPLKPSIRMRPRDHRNKGSMVEVPTPQGQIRGQQKPLTSRNPEPQRRREVSARRSELSAVVPSAATLIIVVCVGFLVLMVILGLVRIHSLHRRVSGAGGTPGASSDPKDPDLFWDDSALTIIVNPMESYQNRQVSVAGAAGGQQEDEDSSDSEAADSPSSDERRIIETPPHRY